MIAWHMLSRGEDYAFARPSLTREKIRKLELATGAERRKGKRNPVRIFATREQHRLDKQLAAQAELAYRRLAQDWQPAIKDAGAAPGRVSRRPSSGQAARQETAHLLRFSSRSPAPSRTLAKEPPPVQQLDLHP